MFFLGFLRQTVSEPATSSLTSEIALFSQEVFAIELVKPVEFDSFFTASLSTVDKDSVSSSFNDDSQSFVLSFLIDFSSLVLSQELVSSVDISRVPSRQAPFSSCLVFSAQNFAELHLSASRDFASLFVAECAIVSGL